MRATVIGRGAIACAMLVSAANAQSPTWVINAGTKLRLRLSDSSEVKGDAVTSSDSAIVLRASGADWIILRKRIRVAEVHHGDWASAGRKGAVVGAIAGAVAITSWASQCDVEACKNWGPIALGGMVGGAIPGFLIGSAIGAARSGWTTESEPIEVVSVGHPMYVGESALRVGLLAGRFSALGGSTSAHGYRVGIRLERIR